MASSRQAIASETYGDADARGPVPGIRLGWLLVRFSFSHGGAARGRAKVGGDIVR